MLLLKCFIMKRKLRDSLEAHLALVCGMYNHTTLCLSGDHKCAQPLWAKCIRCTLEEDIGVMMIVQGLRGLSISFENVMCRSTGCA